MVRQIGVSDYGLYALIGAFLSYFMIDFGLGSAIARFISKFRTEKNINQISNLLGVTSRIYLILDVVIFVILFVTYFLISQIFVELTPIEIEKLKVVYLIAGFFSISSFLFSPVDGVLIAYERFLFLKTADLVQKFLVILLVVVALYADKGLYSLVFINGLVGFIVKLMKFLYIKKHERLKINFKYFDKSLAKELFSFSSWVFIISIAQRLLLNIVPTILGVFSGSKEIAFFSIAMTIEGYIFTFAYALNGLFLPKVTRMVTANESRSEVTNLMIRVGRLQFFVVGLLITGVIVFGKSFLVLWMGEDFLTSYYVVLFLIVPGLITLTQEIAYTLLFVENEVKYRALLFLTASLFSVAIGVCLSPRFGAIGSAIGVGVALLASHVIGMNVVYSKVLRLDIVRFFKSVHIPMAWPIILLSVVFFLLQGHYKIDTWLSLAAFIVLFSLMYFVLMWKYVMNSEEKKLLSDFKNKLKLNG